MNHICTIFVCASSAALVFCVLADWLADIAFPPHPRGAGPAELLSLTPVESVGNGEEGLVAQPNIASSVIKITALLKEYAGFTSKTLFYSSKVVCSTNALSLRRLCLVFRE